VWNSSKIDSSEYTDLNRVIGWFIVLRWVACLVVFVTLLIVRFILHYGLPVNILFTLNGLLFLANLAFTIYHYTLKVQNLSRREMSVFFNVQVCCDYVLLFLLIYFTGFLENPFAYYFVFHIMLTSFIFSATVVTVYTACLLGFFILTVFAEFIHLIPHFPLNPMLFEPAAYFGSIFMRAVGLCSTLLVSAYLIASIKNRIEERGRRIEVELSHYKDLDRTKSNFILQVTHELRGPLAALSGYHEMIMKGITGDINPKTKDAIQKANHRTENLLTIIDEMIDFAYMKSDNEAVYEKKDLKMKEIIDYNIDLFTNRAVQKAIKFVSNCSKDVRVWANRDLLNIILSNMITNAIKYSPQGCTVTINATTEGEQTHLLIKDEGIGIEPEELEKIFEEFYRTRRARKIDRDGTGLGLPIVKRAVEALEGKISIYSEVNKGSTFHIYLPKCVPDTLKIGGNDGKEQDTDH